MLKVGKLLLQKTPRVLYIFSRKLFQEEINVRLAFPCGFLNNTKRTAFSESRPRGFIRKLQNHIRIPVTCRDVRETFVLGFWHLLKESIPKKFFKHFQKWRFYFSKGKIKGFFGSLTIKTDYLTILQKVMNHFIQ